MASHAAAQPHSLGVMTKRIAIAVYRCEVAGIPTDSLDVQVRYFDDAEIDVAAFLSAEPTHSYLNDKGELVTWPLVEITAIETFAEPKNGREVAGFIAGADQFARWARHDA